MRGVQKRKKKYFVGGGGGGGVSWPKILFPAYKLKLGNWRWHYIENRLVLSAKFGACVKNRTIQELRRRTTGLVLSNYVQRTVDRILYCDLHLYFNRLFLMIRTK